LGAISSPFLFLLWGKRGEIQHVSTPAMLDP
jgi:hypothetical protein